MEPQQSLRRRLQTLSKCVCDGARLMVGQGDYAAYAEHGENPMARGASIVGVPSIDTHMSMLRAISNRLG